MRIGLMGLSDKRHVIYSLIRVLGGLGRTIVFTPNLQYLMLSADHLYDFEISDVHVVVHSCDIADLETEYDINLYEYVIYDIQKDMPFELDVGLIMDCREQYLFDLEDRGLLSMPIFTSCDVDRVALLSEEKSIKLPPASFVEPVLQKMFETQTILPINSRVFISGMSSLLSKITNLPASLVSGRLKKGDVKV